MVEDCTEIFTAESLSDERVVTSEVDAVLLGIFLDCPCQEVPAV